MTNWLPIGGIHVLQTYLVIYKGFFSLSIWKIFSEIMIKLQIFSVGTASKIFRILLYFISQKNQQHIKIILTSKMFSEYTHLLSSFNFLARKDTFII
jgi:hypothetical protein